MLYLRKASVSVLFGVLDIFLVGNAVEKETVPGEPGSFSQLFGLYLRPGLNTERTEIIV